MKKLFALVFIGVFMTSALAQDPVTVSSIEELNQAMKAGAKDITGTGEWHGNVNFSANDLIFKGKNLTIYGTVAVMDLHNIKLKNFKVIGAIDLNDSYPQIGLINVELAYITVHGTGARGLFMGGHYIDGINVHHCIFLYNIGGTHNCYLTGAHWDGDYPPVENVRVSYCIFGFTPAGRNNLQFNGRFNNGLIEWNTFYHAQLNAVTLIGCQNFIVRHNVAYGCNRGTGIVIYDYASHWEAYYNHFETQADIDAFRKCHWPCQNIKVIRNTFFVGPKQFSIDPYHHDNPLDNHPVVLINNAVHSGFTIYLPEGIEDSIAEFDMYNPPEPDWYGEDLALDGTYVDIPRPGQEFSFPPKNFIVKDNILVSPKSKMMEIYHQAEAEETSFDGNMVWCFNNGIPYVVGYEYLKSSSGNILLDPKFVDGVPEYGFVDLGINPDYDWTQFKTKFNPFTWRGRELKKGKAFPVIPVGN